ncbi:MAG TPA: hypothetical protein VI408_09870 [Gaiellaceae bacterium]
MQVAYERDHHHPPVLTRAVVALAAVALVLAGPAAAGDVSLPSPLAPLSASPPLGSGAAASAEGVRHRVDARTTVAVAVDRGGAPFRVVATQRLDVRTLGDYTFLIGAPVTRVVAAPGSQSTPGFRTGEILWAGFNPGRRLLASRATLDAAQAAPSLPFGITVAGGRTTLVNRTRVAIRAFDAPAPRAPLLAALARIRASVRADLPPLTGAVPVRSQPSPTTIDVVAPLRVTGTVGGRPVSLLLRTRAVVARAGAVHLRVEPAAALPAAGKSLLVDVQAAILTYARTRQYEMFLGNPDPTGHSVTIYLYDTATRPVAAPVVAPVRHGRNWTTTLVVALAAAAALVAGAAVWARS